jgi:hypothetical protein
MPRPFLAPRMRQLLRSRRIRANVNGNRSSRKSPCSALRMNTISETCTWRVCPSFLVPSSRRQ